MKKIKTITAVLLMVLLAFNVNAQVKKKPIKKKPTAVSKINTLKPVKLPGTRVKITTDSGIVIVRLYDSTPLHRDNFVKLINEGFYDGLLFHRIIKNFMIQGGDPMSKNAAPDQALGMGGGDMERIPAEFRTTLFHKKGALAAARDGNPEKASSACQFYIVQGKKYTDDELNGIETNSGIKFSAAKRSIYKTIGGTPFLDMNYTVFGEVEKGLNVIDKIASVPIRPGDRPIGDVHMKMEIVK